MAAIRPCQCCWMLLHQTATPGEAHPFQGEIAVFRCLQLPNSEPHPGANYDGRMTLNDWWIVEEQLTKWQEPSRTSNILPCNKRYAGEETKRWCPGQTEKGRAWFLCLMFETCRSRSRTWLSRLDRYWTWAAGKGSVAWRSIAWRCIGHHRT